MAFAPQESKVCIIEEDKFASLMQEAEEQEKLDMGSVLVYRMQHPHLGNIALINTDSAKYGMIQMS